MGTPAGKSTIKKKKRILAAKPHPQTLHLQDQQCGERLPTLELDDEDDDVKEFIPQTEDDGEMELIPSQSFPEAVETLMSDDESPIQVLTTPPKSLTNKMQLKRPSRVIQTALSAVKNDENTKRVKSGTQYRTPNFSSTRMTRSKTRTKPSLETPRSSSVQKTQQLKLSRQASNESLSRPPSVAKSSSVKSSLVTPSLGGSTGKLNKLSKTSATPNQKSNTATKPRITDSAMKRRKEEEERRMKSLQEKIDKEQRAKKKKEEQLNKRVLDHRVKREEREKKVAEQLEKKRLLEEKAKAEKEKKRAGRGEEKQLLISKVQSNLKKIDEEKKREEMLKAKKDEMKKPTKPLTQVPLPKIIPPVNSFAIIPPKPAHMAVPVSDLPPKMSNKENTNKALNCTYDQR